MHHHAPVFIWVSAALYAVVGLSFMVAPEAMGGWVALDLDAALARTDVRAVYGGLDLGLALFLLWTTRDPTRTEAGVLAATAGVVGLALGRSIGLLVDGVVVENVGFLVMELAFVAAGLLVWRSGRGSRPS